MIKVKALAIIGIFQELWRRLNFLCIQRYQRYENYYSSPDLCHNELKIKMYNSSFISPLQACRGDS